MNRQVKDLQVGDTVIIEATKQVVRVEKIGNGFYRGSKLLSLSNGDDSCMLNNETVEVVSKMEQNK